MLPALRDAGIRFGGSGSPRFPVPTVGARVPLSSHAGRGGDSPALGSWERLALAQAGGEPGMAVSASVLAAWLNALLSSHLRWSTAGLRKRRVDILRCHPPG